MDEAGGHFPQGTRYGKEEIVAFAGGRHGVIGDAFLDPAIAKDLKIAVPGKDILDIGCGIGDWCVVAAQYGANTVHGFDIQEDMVKRATEVTCHTNNIHIKVGDVADMPYKNDKFDVAISLFVTCNLSPNTYSKHFHELYRVLSPGGKAILLVPTDISHSKLLTKMDANPKVVEENINKILHTLPKYPSTIQVTEAFGNVSDIIMACFAVDENGDIFHVKHANQLTDGQPIWRRTEVMMFPNYFYSDQSILNEIASAGLTIDKTENYCTEEGRVAYNGRNPAILLSKEFVVDSTALVHYLRKPSV